MAAGATTSTVSAAAAQDGKGIKIIGVYDPADPKASQGGFADLIPVLSRPNVAAIVR